MRVKVKVAIIATGVNLAQRIVQPLAVKISIIKITGDAYRFEIILGTICRSILKPRISPNLFALNRTADFTVMQLFCHVI